MYNVTMSAYAMVVAAGAVASSYERHLEHAKTMGVPSVCWRMVEGDLRAHLEAHDELVKVLHAHGHHKVEAIKHPKWNALMLEVTQLYIDNQ